MKSNRTKNARTKNRRTKNRRTKNTRRRKSVKNKNNSNKKILCYTGIGAKKSGIYSEKEFVKIMNKKIGRECGMYLNSLKCKSCIKSKKLNMDMLNRSIDREINKNYKMSKKNERNEKNLSKMMKLCEKCKEKNIKKCSLEEFMNFSGAELVLKSECKI